MQTMIEDNRVEKDGVDTTVITYEKQLGGDYDALRRKDMQVGITSGSRSYGHGFESLEIWLLVCPVQDQTV